MLGNLNKTPQEGANSTGLTGVLKLTTYPFSWFDDYTLSSELQGEYGVNITWELIRNENSNLSQKY